MELGTSYLHCSALISPWFLSSHYLLHGLPVWYSGKECTCQCRKLKRRRFDPCVWKIPWRRKWQPASVFLPEKFQGQKSLVGYIQYMVLQKVRYNWVIKHSTCYIVTCLFLSNICSPYTLCPKSQRKKPVFCFNCNAWNIWGPGYIFLMNGLD